MKITFVVPALNLTGGLRVISIYAELLSRKGHTVTVVSPNKKTPTLKDRVKTVLKWKGYQFKSYFDTTFFENADYRVVLSRNESQIFQEDVPDADIVIATFWSTAEWVAEFSPKKGRKVYFIQGYEVHPWMPKRRVEATFKLPFKKIVVSKWIADILYNKYSLSDVTIVGNGVDDKQFYSRPRSKNACFTVGVMYANELSPKGCNTSIAAVLKARELIPNVKLVAFARRSPVASLPLPENSEFYLKPAQEDIRAIYGQCDAWLFGSRSEGFGLPILEAMACGTPVIGTRAGAAPELLQQGAGFLVDVDDVDAMAAAIVKMAKMEAKEWLTFSDNAFAVAKEHSWVKKVDEFEQAILN